MSSLNYQLPLTFNDQLVDNTKLGGYNYVRGMPELMQLVKAHNDSCASGSSAPNTVIYPGVGPQQMYASPGGSWLPGARLFCYATPTIGSLAVGVIIRVISYNPATGLLWFENQYQSCFSDYMSATWIISLFYPELIITTNTLARGLTGANNVRTARANLQLGLANSYGEIMFDDYIGRPNSIMIDSTQNNALLRAGSIVGIDPVNHPGIGRLNPSAVSAYMMFAFNDVWHGDLMDLSGAGDAIEIAFTLPTLSTSSQRYTITAGLLNPRAGATGPIAYVSYVDNVNTGQFFCTYGNQTTNATNNFTIAPVAGAWNRIRVERSGANILFSVYNGTTTQTFNAPTTNLTGLGIVRGSPAIKIVKNVGVGAANCDVDYLYVRKQLASGR